MLSRGFTASQHSGKFVDAAAGLNRFDPRNGAALLEFFGDDEMRAGRGSHLGQMGDAQDLALRSDLPHFFADGHRRFATDVGIDFIENQNRNLVFGCEHGLNR